MSAPHPSVYRLNHAMDLAAIAVHYATAYARFANVARHSTGSERCRSAARAGAYKRRAARYARLHNETLATLRG